MSDKKKIILGITGGIAAYKAAEIARLLTKQDFEVQVIMTRTAEDFITTLTFETLTGRKVYKYNSIDEEKPMLHIDLAKWADLILVAPTTAEFLAKILHGRADDLLSTTLLAHDKKVVIAPSMNKNMWENSATQENCRQLKSRGIIFSGPEHGDQACGDIGSGRMREPKDIVNDINSLEKRKKKLFKNKKVVITAGPTEEAIDPVRYISNRSSGMMGCEIANAFHAQGAKVIIVKGPCKYSQNNEIESINVKTASEMLMSVEKNITNCDIFVSVAAVSDFIAKKLSSKKIKSEDIPKLELEKNIDIIKKISENYKVFSIGFAAETSELKENALKKLKEKKLSVIAANKVSFTEGIDAETNSITLFWGDGKEKTLSLKNKKDLAIEFVEEISNIYN
ncbi:MAG: bifunctional phosphopantothenoylcysteine decarboxylase/phosphopantothenate--cysteine ligase CoaBC [Pseudomonadota bacterium]|jgi:phosphopantothenoylcysteine decarboxylase/phosphopantothenate--cysteine ligase|nr:bifunctional phosphopantothenoylcysteine decarboxylase/phosphopantothenate--cysteine ligase CoaBC [Pseudomonadota bacterium]